MSFLTRGQDASPQGQEAILAQRIEQLYTKDEILEIYLNKVYFGDGLYGAEAAARGYFGKPASELTLAEAALLAGLVKSPSACNPTVNLERATARRNVVLKLMLRASAHRPGRSTMTRAGRRRLRCNDDLRREDPTGLHFKEQVRRELVERFGKDASTREACASTRRSTRTCRRPPKTRSPLAEESSARDQADRAKRRAPHRKAARPLQAALLALDPRDRRSARDGRRPRLRRASA